MPPFDEIQAKSRREHVRDQLRDAILDGELKPGDALIEADLAAALKVSRAPLREALQILATEGLVENIPYHGTTVRLLTPKDIEELYSLRGVLEAFAIERIMERNDPQTLVTLREIYEAMVQAALAGDLKRLNVEDQNFHNTLIALSGHALLLTMWNLVSNRVRQVMALRNQQNSDLVQIAGNHIPIMDAMAARNSTQAKKLMQKHTASAADLVLESWKNMVSDSEKREEEPEA